jgi:RPA family protein
MIKRGSRKTKLIFGTGDILTYAGYMNIKGKIYATVCSKNSFPTTIGKINGAETTQNVKKCPVIMMFSNIESLDCMIQALEHAKKAMQEASHET